jgi:hypothetical protein
LELANKATIDVLWALTNCRYDDYNGRIDDFLYFLPTLGGGFKELRQKAVHLGLQPRCFTSG